MTTIVLLNNGGAARPIPRCAQLYRGYFVIESLNRNTTGATLIRGCNNVFRVLQTFDDGASYGNGWRSAAPTAVQVCRILNRAERSGRLMGELHATHRKLLAAYRARAAACRALNAV